LRKSWKETPAEIKGQHTMDQNVGRKKREDRGKPSQGYPAGEKKTVKKKKKPAGTLPPAQRQRNTKKVLRKRSPYRRVASEKKKRVQKRRRKENGGWGIQQSTTRTKWAKALGCTREKRKEKVNNMCKKTSGLMPRDDSRRKPKMWDKEPVGQDHKKIARSLKPKSKVTAKGGGSAEVARPGAEKYGVAKQVREKKAEGLEGSRKQRGDERGKLKKKKKRERG